nr:hypothetical protein [Tanacetum cinerariifolium]
MTRSSTNELFTPFKDPEREFRSPRKFFKTLSLDESRSPNFDLFSDQEEYSEEEVTEIMTQNMEQYMSKTRADYGSRVARPKIEDKDNFELKDQFLKELRTNTFSGLDHEDANEHTEKVFEIVDLFHIPNITIDQVMLRAFAMSLTRAISYCLRNKPSELILKECMENARTKSSLSNTNTNDDVDIELSKEFLMELKCNSYHGTFNEDVVDHIAKDLAKKEIDNVGELSTIWKCWSLETSRRLFNTDLAQ